MPIVATQLVASVEVENAEETLDALLAIGDSADAAGEHLTNLEGISIDGLSGQIEQISVAIEDLVPQAEDASAAFETLSSSGDGLDVLSQILAAIQQQTSLMIDEFEALDGTMQSVADQVMSVAMAVEDLDTSLAGMSATEGDAADATEGLGAGLESLQSAMGPLMMIGTLAAMAGAKFVQMGMSGQQGEALLGGAANASQADISALMDDAQKLGMTMDQASQGYYQAASAVGAGTGALADFDAATRLAIGEQADEGATLSALTSVMHDYNIKTSQAMSVSDQMAKTILLGKQSMNDYASSIGPLAAEAANLGITFQTVNAAEAAMTQINPHVRQDASQLTALFKTLSPTMGTVADTAKKLGLNFDETHFKSLDLLGQLKYLAQIAGGENTQAFIKLTGGAQGSAAAIDLLSNKGSAFKNNMLALGQSTGATQQAFEKYEHTIPGALDHVGASLSVFATKIMDAVGPKVGPVIAKFGDDISKVADLVLNHTSEVMPILGGLAAMLGTVLVVAMGSFLVSMAPILAAMAAVGLAVAGGIAIFQHFHEILASPVGDVIIGILAGITAGVLAFVATTIPPLIAGFISWAVTAGAAAVATIAATWPFLAIGAAVALVVTGIILAIQHWGQIVQFLQGVWNAFTSWFMGILHTIGSFFAGVWHGMISGLQSSWNTIVNVVRTALQLLWNGFTAPFRAIGALFVWLFNHNTYFHDLVVKIQEYIQIGLAAIQIIWQTWVTWLTNLWQGIVSIASKAWNAVWNTVKFIVGSIITTLHGLWTSAINGLAMQWNGLKDLMSKAWNAVSGVISSAWNTYVSKPLQDLWNSIVGFANGWPKQALQWGINLIQSFIQGIESMAGAVGNAAQNIAKNVAKFLGFHSPAEAGPGAELDEWPKGLVGGFSKGLIAEIPTIQSALNSLALPIKNTLSINPVGTGSFSMAGAFASHMAGQQPQIVYVQPPDLYLDGYKVSRPLMPHIVRHWRTATGT